VDKPLTSFTPIEKQAIIGLSPKALLLIFPYLTAYSQKTRL
jgi:hypothetical protein